MILDEMRSVLCARGMSGSRVGRWVVVVVRVLGNGGNVVGEGGAWEGFG